MINVGTRPPLIRWSQIRAHLGSQDAAFEELCAQLARHEPGFPAGSRFVRKGRPDAGVECYWRTPAGAETAWQAKYVLNSPTTSQWGDCDKSVKRVLASHPDLSRYIFCFPTDLADERAKGKKSAQDRWDARVKKWEGWASERGMAVAFELWNSSALLDRLSRDQHRGRVWFWFDVVGLTPEWFRRKLDSTTLDLDQRYQPDLHVEVEVQQALDALVGADGAAVALDDRITGVRTQWDRLPIAALSAWHPAELQDATASLQRALDEALALDPQSVEPVGRAPALSTLDRVATEIGALADDLLGDLGEGDDRNARLGAYHRLAALQRSVDELRHHILRTLHFAEEPFMLLAGRAGMGKSHIAAHLADRLVSEDRPAVMLLGEHFQPGEPWPQIAARLGLAGLAGDSILGALESAAQASGRRALLVVDALNEHGAGVHKMWRTRLAGMRAEFLRFPSVAVLLTLRTPFEEAVLPAPLRVGDHIVRHGGFAGRESDALTSFLASFRLPPPRTPLLLPEFSNPLFLKLYCETLRARLDRGEALDLDGFVPVLDAWLDEAEGRAAEQMDADVRDRLVHRGVAALAEAISENGLRPLELRRAKAVLEEVQSSVRHSRSLFKALVDQCIIVEVPHWDEGAPTIRFQYERMQDVFVARAVVSSHLATRVPLTDLATSPAMAALLTNPWSGVGVLDALANLLPTEHGIELTEVLSEEVYGDGVERVIAALPGRPARSIGHTLLALVRRELDCREAEELGVLLDVLLLVSGEPHHPLNARFLHDWLSPLSMHDRDLCWSAALAHHHESGTSATQRLIDWARTSASHDALEPEARLLTGFALGWMLSTSHRPLRDQATKALVRLFDRDLHTLATWLSVMQEVNDPYVVERALAAAYGAATRAPTTAGVGPLAQLVYDRWFVPGPPPVHLLARDYARNIVEFAAARGQLARNVDIGRVRPPYVSEWIEPAESLEELKAKFGGGRSQLLSSMVGGGDFDRYCVGSNSWRFPWLATRWGEAGRPGRETVLEDFEQTLDADQTALWEEYGQSRDSGQWLRRAKWVLSAAAESGEEDLLEPDGGGRGDESDLATWKAWIITQEPDALQAEGDRWEREALDELERSLKPEQLARLRERVLGAMDDSFDRLKDDFDLGLARRWLLQCVLDLGWDEATLGALDRRLHRQYRGRTAHKSERLGKKYQWIALHRFLATVADHFRFRGDGEEANAGYEGPWDVDRRDLDPTCLLAATGEERFKTPRAWWTPVTFDPARGEESNKKWLTQPRSLPDPRRLLEVSGPRFPGVRWVPLNLSLRWDEPRTADLKRVRTEQRSLSLWSHAYVVRTEHLESTLAWARPQNFYSSWMPSVPQLTPRLMLRERGWGPAWAAMTTPWHGTRGWSQSSGGRDLPHPVLPTWDYYMAELSTHDTSIEDSFNLCLIDPLLQEELGLVHGRSDGHFVDAKNDVAGFDPTVRERGPGALLLRSDLIEVLADRGLSIIWTLSGEQRAQELAPGGYPDGLLGRTEVSGAFVRREAGWEGTLRVVPRGIGPDDAPDQQWVIEYVAGDSDPTYRSESMPAGPRN